MSDKITLVGFCGSRNLGAEWRILVEKTVQTVARAGRGIAVGCATGADAMALRACFTEHWALQAPHLRVFAAFGPGGDGDWAGSATRLVQTAAGFPQASGVAGNGRRIVVNWWAGGDGETPLVQRLKERTRSMVEAVAASGEGRGLIAFVTGGPDKSPGTWGAVKLAIEQGVPVVVFPCGCSAKDFPALGEGTWVKTDKGIWAVGWRWSPAGGASHDAANESNTTFVEHARRLQPPRPNLCFPRNQKNAVDTPPSPQPADATLLDQELLAPTTLRESVFNFLGWRELPARRQGRVPSLPPLLGYRYRRYRPRRKGRETVESTSRPPTVIDALLVCAATVLVVGILAGCLSGALIPASPTPKTSQKAPMLWAYHEHAKVQLDALARDGCVKATDYCLGSLLSMTKFPGGDVLTIENYHFHLTRQMVDFTDSHCFVPSDRCLDDAFRAIEPPEEGAK